MNSNMLLEHSTPWIMQSRSCGTYLNSTSAITVSTSSFEEPKWRRPGTAIAAYSQIDPRRTCGLIDIAFINLCEVTAQLSRKRVTGDQPKTGLEQISWSF